MSERADPLLTVAEVVERLATRHNIRIARKTWNSYVFRGQAPKADDPDDDRPPNKRMPRWLASTVDRYAEERPGMDWANGVPKAAAGQRRMGPTGSDHPRQFQAARVRHAGLVQKHARLLDAGTFEALDPHAPIADGDLVAIGTNEFDLRVGVAWRVDEERVFVLVADSTKPTGVRGRVARRGAVRLFPPGE